MSVTVIRCDRCGGLLGIGQWNTGRFVSCACGSKVRVEAYPTLVSPLQGGKSGQDLLAEDQASCYYHPQKQATAPCDVCGRFLCDLCDVALGKGHVCAQCLWTSMSQSSDERFCVRRQTFDSAALAMAIIPITAPLGLYYAIRHWNSAGSVLGTRKWLFVVAGIVSVLGTLGWGYLLLKVILEVAGR